MSNGIHDRAVMIGTRKTLVGIVTQPIHYEPEDRPVFVILNTGIIHRVGHHRMYVTLARMLARVGFQVLRFDLSGVGDSERREDGLSPLDGALADVREAVDWLGTSRRAQKIILVGLCSGADQALVYGISDERVCGLVLLDPSIPPTRKYYLRLFLRRLISMRSWLKFVTGGGAVWKTVRKLLAIPYDDAWERHRVNLSDSTIRVFLQSAYEQLMDRGIDCLAVFTSGLEHQHNYPGQIFDAFPKIKANDCLQLEYFSLCDHLFTSEADRERLFRIVMEWARKANFAGRATAESHPHQAVNCLPSHDLSYQVQSPPTRVVAARQ